MTNHPNRYRRAANPPTLAEALDRRLAQAALVGWRLSRRRHIEIAAGYATLTLGWLSDAALSDVDAASVGGNGEHISIDTQNLPDGVTISSWTSLPDTRDAIIVPTDAEVREAAAKLGCRHVDKGESDRKTIYWMVA